ncbi:PEP-CTERM sorting domain-containing protein [Candidatus Poribacteria bacterium]|nr:PEP-CTERM sorting domain-containing protein [Candidatus Poribacteria bacterium]
MFRDMVKMKKLFVLFATLMVIGMIQEADASLINPGFETGDTTGWTLTIPSGGSALAVPSHISDLYSIYGPAGSYLLELKTDGPDSYTTASQSVTLNAGDTLEGWAAFDAWDYLPWNDNASVQIFDAIGGLIAQPWYSDVSIVGDYGDGPWTYWNWTASVGGTYTLTYRVANAGDDAVDSYALFDDGPGSFTPIPEPTTIILMSFGLIGLVGIGVRSRRKRK